MQDLIKRFLRAPKTSFFIFGPRGTGKTSWTVQHYADALRIDLLTQSVLNPPLPR